MGKKNRKSTAKEEQTDAPIQRDGGVWFQSTDAVLEATRKQVGLMHVNKPWTRDAWERAKPWVLEQRQKLEDEHWIRADGLRTELFVLRKPAPSAADSEDGYLWYHAPRKWVDFLRSGKSDDDRRAEEKAKGHHHHRVQHRRMIHGHVPSYDLGNPFIFPVRVEQSDEHPSSVLLDCSEPLENIFYLIMCLQPGLARLHAQRQNVIQPNTKKVDSNSEAEVPSMRIQAMVADQESYVRLLPPSYWIKRNAPQLSKILGQVAFDATLAAAEEESRSTQRTVINVQEKVWEEALPANTQTEKKKKKGKKARQAAAMHQQEGAEAGPMPAPLAAA